MKILCWIKKSERFYLFKTEQFGNTVEPKDIPTPMFWYVVHFVSPEMIENQYQIGQLLIDDSENTFMLLEK